MTALRPHPFDWARLITAQRGPLLHLAALDAAVPLLRGGLCYLATPYSREVVTGGQFDPRKSDLAARGAAHWAALLARRGVTAASPIAQAAGMVAAGQDLDPLDVEFWTRWCRPLLHAARTVAVPPLMGWKRSAGIWHEVNAALGAQKPVVLLLCEGDE